MKRILQIMAVLFAFTASAAVVEVHSISELTNALKNAADDTTIRLMKDGSPYKFSQGCMGKGGEPDLDKAAAVLMDDFRSGRLGRVTLEAPEA